MVFAVFLHQSPLHALDAAMPLESKKISLDYKNAELTDVLKAMSYSYNLNIVVAKDITGKVSAQLKDVTAEEALNAILTGSSYAYMRKGDIIYVQSKEEMDLVTETLVLNYIPLEQAQTLLSGAITRLKANIQVNKDANALVVTTNPGDLEKLKVILQGIDVPPIQVLIEAQIVDINRSDIQQIDSAVSLIYSANQVGGTFSKFSPNVTAGSASNTAATSTSNTSSSSTSSTSGDQGVFSFANNNYSQMSITALVNQHKARVIASPSIATLNGHEASIVIGEKYPVVTSTSSAGGTGGSIVNQTTTSYIDIGTKLKVTPRVSPDGWITMKIEPEVSSVLGVTSNGNPNIATRSANTEVRVRDNETIVIGGLKSKSDLRDKNGIPGLKDIPILGALFQSHNKSLVDGELTVLITPHVIPMVHPEKAKNPPPRKVMTGEDSVLVHNILNYIDTLEADRSKDRAKNLYLSGEQIKAYRMLLQEFPASGKGDYCLYRIALKYAKDFGNCKAAKETFAELQELFPTSSFIPVTESLVDACTAVQL